MTSVQDFKDYVASIQNEEGYQKPTAFGIGVRKMKGDKTLEVFFPLINYETAYGTAALLQDVSGYKSNENGYAVLNKGHLQIAFDKFEAFHNEIDQHPNIKVIHELLTLFKYPKGYAQVDLIAYFLFDKDTAVALSLIHI